MPVHKIITLAANLI